jgi:hypothetical protein
MKFCDMLFFAVIWYIRKMSRVVGSGGNRLAAAIVTTPEVRINH